VVAERDGFAMTNEQRKQAFIIEYNQLMNRYGLVIQIEGRNLSGVWQLEMQVVPIQDWQPPQSENGQVEVLGELNTIAEGEGVKDN